MASAKILATCRRVERLRGAQRDAARSELAASTLAAQAADQKAQDEAGEVAVAVRQWNELLERPSPDPAMFGLAGAQLIRTDDRHKAAVLDQKIAWRLRDETATQLARAEARVEGSRLVTEAAQRDHHRRREARGAREAEDAFLARRKA